MRAPFTALMVSRRGINMAHPFEKRGALARNVPFDLLIATLKMRSRIIAEAIVIDGATPDNGGDGLTLAGVLAREVRALEDSVCMPNGIRWCRVPIVIVVENDEQRRRAYGDPMLNGLTLASAHPGWDAAYQTVAKAVQAFGERLVEEYRSAGWRIREEHGRYIRDAAPKLRRVGGQIEHIQTDLYDGSHDEWHNQRGIGALRRVALIHTDPSAIERDVDELHSILNHRHEHTEHRYQRFVNDRSYIVGAAPYELTAQARFQSPHTGKMRAADYVQERVQLSEYDPPSRLIDLKDAQKPLLVAARDYKRVNGATATGIRQLRGYREDLEDPRSEAQLRALIPNGGDRLGRGLLVAGTLDGVDLQALENERTFYGDTIQLLTYSELLTLAEDRYLQDQDDVPDPLAYGERRMGLPPTPRLRGPGRRPLVQTPGRDRRF